MLSELMTIGQATTVFPGLLQKCCWAHDLVIPVTACFHNSVHRIFSSLFLSAVLYLLFCYMLCFISLLCHLHRVLFFFFSSFQRILLQCPECPQCFLIQVHLVLFRELFSRRWARQHGVLIQTVHFLWLIGGGGDTIIKQWIFSFPVTQCTFCGFLHGLLLFTVLVDLI